MTNSKINRESFRWLALEGTAIVMSILMAFAIEAWWEDRQDEIRRQGLIDAMKLEFQATQGRLESRIEYADSIIDGTVEFLKIDSHEQYSVEELGQLIQGIFQGILFQESLPAYESALSSGSLALIDSPQFFAAIARFYDALSFHKYVSDISGRIYFQGSTWELRRMLGSTRALLHRGAGNDVPERFRLTEPELREIFASKILFAAVENTTVANQNIRSALIDMQSAVAEILIALEDID